MYLSLSNLILGHVWVEFPQNILRGFCLMYKWSAITKWSEQVFDVELWWEAALMQLGKIKLYPLSK